MLFIEAVTILIQRLEAFSFCAWQFNIHKEVWRVLLESSRDIAVDVTKQKKNLSPPRQLREI